MNLACDINSLVYDWFTCHNFWVTDFLWIIPLGLITIYCVYKSFFKQEKLYV